MRRGASRERTMSELTDREIRVEAKSVRRSLTGVQIPMLRPKNQSLSAVRMSRRGRGREGDPRVKKLCRLLGLGLLAVTRRGRKRVYKSVRWECSIFT